MCILLVAILLLMIALLDTPFGEVAAALRASGPKVFELGLTIAVPFLLLGLQLMLLADSNGNLAQPGYTLSYMFAGTFLGARTSFSFHVLRWHFCAVWGAHRNRQFDFVGRASDPRACRRLRLAVRDCVTRVLGGALPDARVRLGP